jgi:hypothetical protein
MMMDNLVEWRLAGETEVLGGNLPQRHFVHHKSHLTRPGIEPGPPRWEWTQITSWRPEYTGRSQPRTIRVILFFRRLEMCLPKGCPAMDYSVLLVAAGTCVWLAINSSSGSTIPAFRRHVTVCSIGLPGLLGRESHSFRLAEQLIIQRPRTISLFLWKLSRASHSTLNLSILWSYKSCLVYSCLLILVPTSSSLLNLWPSWRCFSDIHY